MINLKNGCTATEIKVTPKNWQTSKHSISKNWFIQFYFSDPNYKDKYPNGKQIRIKRMNKYKDIEDRREITKYIIEDIKRHLIIDGYNYITETYHEDADLSLDTYTTFEDALTFALDNSDIAHNTKLDFKSMLKYIRISILYLGFSKVAISKIKRKHIKLILNHQLKSRKLSDNRHNKYLNYLSSLFGVLIEYDAIENNPCSYIKKKRVLRKFREVLSGEEMQTITKHLKLVNYNFYRYTMIFYYSGSRSSELLRLQVKDVNIENQEFKIVIKKGSQYKEVIKPININVLPLWIEVLKNTKISDFVFSENLEPGINSITSPQITRRWRTWVKKPLGITADFYSLKHSYLDEVVKQLSMQHAQKMAGHTSDRMLIQHYAVNEEQRQLDRLKNLDSPFMKVV